MLRVSLAALALLGCSPSLEEQAAGTWAVDPAPWLADPELAAASAPARAALDPIVRGMVRETRFVFEPGRCVRRVAGRERVHRCVTEGVERAALVLRETAPDGAVDWIRLRPDGDRMRMTRGPRTLPLVRVGSDPPGAEKR